MYMKQILLSTFSKCIITVINLISVISALIEIRVMYAILNETKQAYFYVICD